jgi:6-pyruvoyltetrahydropterin/6-carboxytetrahydropterin synthase
LIIGKRYHFESAHKLPLTPDGHKCRNLHGHNYVVDIEFVGEVNARGWVWDFGKIDDYVTPIILDVDHVYLNNVEGLENPTAEIIAAWFFNRLFNELVCNGGPRLKSITIFETPECWARHEIP